LGNNYVWAINTLIHLNQFIFNKIEKPILLQIKLLQFEKSQSETLANCYRNLAALNLQWRKLSWLIPILKKLTPIFLKFPMYLRKTSQIQIRSNLLFEQKKYGEATEIISDVFKILIPNYSNRDKHFTQLKILYAETILLDAIDLQAVIFLEQNQPKKALQAYALSFQIEDLFANYSFMKTQNH
jgi:hypothetical protein